LRRSLVRAMILYGGIQTTKAKAKFIQRDIEKIVTHAKSDKLSDVRHVYSFLLNNREITDRILKIAKESFSSRNSGYTRIVYLPARRGDAAEMARIEWSDKIIAGDVKPVKGKKGEIKNENKKEPKIKRSILTTGLKIGKKEKEVNKAKK